MGLHARLGSFGATLAVAAPLALFPCELLAQPVPVLPVVAQERGPANELVARVAAAAGAEAVQGAPLAESLAPRFGRFAPQDDPLRPQRAEIDAAVQVYFHFSSSATAQARRRFEAAVQAMQRAPDALELNDENRGRYVRALMCLGRIGLEAREPAADAWFRRVIEFDPGYAPPPSEFPPHVVQRFAHLRGAQAPVGAQGHLHVRTPREGCSVTVDGAPRPGTAREQDLTLPAGVHRVSASCGQPSRVRAVTVTAGGDARVDVDPRLDATLQVSGTAALRYAGAGDATNLLAGDAAAVGRSLGARRVVVVGVDEVRVIDVESAQVVATVPANATDLAARVRAAATGSATAHEAAPRVIAAPRVEAEGPGVGPWVVVGAGAAVAVAGAVLLGLSLSELHELDAACPRSAAGALQCGQLAGAQRAEAQGHYDTAGSYNLAGWVGVGVGGAAVAGGVLWYLLAPRGTARVASGAPTLRGSVAPGGGSVELTLRF